MIAVRRRNADDLPACVHILAEVHAEDGYPLRWPSDPSTWLEPPGCAAAWVAEGDGRVVGHVGVVRGGDQQLASLLAGVAAERLAAVSRLFVAPSARGQAVGAALLAAASSFADDEQLQLLLDVVEGAGPAVALYERLGWELLDRRPAEWVAPSGERPTVRIYASPRARR